MKKLQLKLGCDPECFLIDSTGQLKSAIGKIGGSKRFPLPLMELGDGYAVQEDNVAMEFNIPAAANSEEFVTSIGKVLDYLEDGIRKSYDLKISHLSAASFPEQELQDPAAQEFGCDPDYNAWTNRRNPRPKADDKNLRSCGGHIHIGYDKSVINPVNVIRAMDLFLGIPSILMDKGELRKQLYGKAGAFREKSYGVEYRTLSNWWTFTPELRSWVWRNTERAVEAAVAQFPVEEDKELILEAINSNNKDIAEHLIGKHKLECLIV